MEKDMILSPEELYYLGTTLQARYIDYAYVAAMNDIKQNYALFETETRASLVSSGVLMEDFSGNVEVDAAALALLKPIFFGETETSVDVCALGEPNRVLVYKMHFCDGAVTLVTCESGKLVLKSIDQLGIKDLVSGLLPANYAGTDDTVAGIDKEKITRFIAVKQAVVGRSAQVKTYIEAEGVLHRETEDGRIERLSGDRFIEDVYTVVKGA